MIRCITCDAEQAALLAAAADMAHAALAARRERVDPEGVLGKSLEMSRIKTEGLLNQLQGPALAEWQDLNADQWKSVLAIMGAIINADSLQTRIALWPKLQAFVLLRGSAIPVTHAVHARPDGYLPGSKVAKSKEAAAEIEAHMRKVRGERGD